MKQPAKVGTNTKTRPVFSLESPYPDPQWPNIEQSSADTIVDLLCSLLSPIAEYRQKYADISTGKRDKKQRRKRATIDSSQPAPVSENAIPAHPELYKYLTIGFNSTNRCLEEVNRRSIPTIEQDSTESRPNATNDAIDLAVIVCDKASMSPALWSQLPLLIATASYSNGLKAPIRLVALPRGSGERLAVLLKIPRTGIIGVAVNAPNAEPLLDFVEKHVAPVEISWLDDLKQARYVPVSILTSQIVVPSKPKAEPKSKIA